MEHTILELTHYYVRAFDQRDVEVLEEMLDEDVSLVDPGISTEGREQTIDYICEIYKTTDHLNFYATNIFADEKQRFSIIEFELELDEKKFRGTDHLYWSTSGRIEKLEAFLYQTNSPNVELSATEVYAHPNDQLLGEYTRKKFHNR